MNSIHPTAVVTGDVRLGSGNTIGPFAVISGPVRIGDGNWIGTGVVIGAPPEVRGWEHPPDASELTSGNGILIGSRNVIREYAQVHQGWKSKTTLGDDVFVMNQSYIAHDCRLEDRATLASSVLLAGNVQIGFSANLGLGAMVHQGRLIGRGAMVGMGSVISRDIPPFSKAFGSPARVRGANLVGMERAGIPSETAEAVERLYDGDLDAQGILDGLRAIAGMSAAANEWAESDAVMRLR